MTDEAREKNYRMRVRIDNDFVYHKPLPGQPEIYTQLRDKAKELALMIVELVPEGREQSSALTRLEEAVFHANAGIARHGEPG